ncbi:extensin family protein [uncultured Enterovirga sp.]|uniref:extensin-like domain-containing protein n=1 Tax=uncultured Enterovirga sp. TaxID=2026352 RepID=UPI0035C96A2A
MSALVLLGAGLVGCGRFSFETREAWRVQAEEACLAAKLVAPSAYMSRAAEIDGPGSCGITYPYRAQALAGGDIRLTSAVTLACPIIPEIDRWLAGTVQPAAELYLGQAVTGIRAGSYSCRPRNNQSGAKVSEHAYGNALDVFAFRLADGREITVEKGWRGAADEQDFLREVFVGACRHFTTVLAPGSDVFHYNHFHLDLARHDTAGRRRVCKPLIKYEPRLGPDRVAGAPPLFPARTRPEPAMRPGMEEDEDSETVSEGSRVHAAPLRTGQERTSLPVAPRSPASAGTPMPLQPHLAGAGRLY